MTSFLRILILMLFATKGLSSPDSLDAVSKKPYIRPCIFLSHFQTPVSELRNQSFLADYSFKQTYAGFYAPLVTRTWYAPDQVTLPNLHILLTGNLLSTSPMFSGIRQQFNAVRLGLGGRLIYNDGKGNTWFADLSPFLSDDPSRFGRGKLRTGWSVLYNKTVSRKFSYRLGLSKTWLFGTGLETRRHRFGPYFPLLGIRIGPLDGTYLSIQFPRNISLNFNFSRWMGGSVFIRPSGGIFNMHSRDLGFIGGEDSTAILQFGRYEFLNGFRIDIRPGSVFSAFISTGASINRQVSFAKKSGIYFDPLYASRVAPSFFLYAGVSVRFGKTRNVQQHAAMFDIFELQSTFDPGDQNMPPAGTDIPPGVSTDPKKLGKIQYKDIEDLFENTEF